MYVISTGRFWIICPMYIFTFIFIYNIICVWIPIRCLWHNVIICPIDSESISFVSISWHFVPTLCHFLFPDVCVIWCCIVPSIYLHLNSASTWVTFQIPSLVRFHNGIYFTSISSTRAHVVYSFLPVILIPDDPRVSVIHEPSAQLVQWGTAGRNKRSQSHLCSCLVSGLTAVYERACSRNHFSYSVSQLGTLLFHPDHNGWH